MGLLTNINIIWFDLKLKLFIHSYLLLLKQQTWKCKRNASCACFVVHLLSIFEILGQKLKVLLRILCGTKINLEWIPPPPPPPHF